jgi:hypothetical protein
MIPRKLILAFAKPVGLYKIFIKFQTREVRNVHDPAEWVLGADGLKIRLPSEKPADYGCALKISGDGIV